MHCFRVIIPQKAVSALLRGLKDHAAEHRIRFTDSALVSVGMLL